MDKFDAGSGLSYEALHSAFFVVIVGVSLMWAGWVIVRTYKLYSRGRLDEQGLMFSTLQTFAIVIIVNALVLVM